MADRWVLVEELATERKGGPVYFMCMTGIGPAATAKLEDAARFPSRDAALRCLAHLHGLSFYEPVEVEP